MDVGGPIADTARARGADGADGMPPWPDAMRDARPAALPRLGAAEVQARSSIAQKLAGLPIAWDAHTWHLRLAPLAEGGACAVAADEWCARLQWAGADFELLLPAAAARDWIAGRFDDLEGAREVPELPDEYAAAALEAACAQTLQALASLQRGPAHLMGIERGPARSAPHVHAFELELSRGGDAGVVLRARLATNRLGLLLIAGLLVRLPARGNDAPWSGLPVLLRAEIGCSWLPAGELASLQRGDVVLFQQALVDQDGQFWLACGAGGLRVVCDEIQLSVTQTWSAKGSCMSQELEPPAGAEASGLADLPLRLVFDIGERSITLGQLQSLQVGQALVLDHPLSQAVNLRVNGSLVGTGELIEVDGRLGVAISQLRGAALTAEAVQPGARDMDGYESQDGNDNDEALHEA